MHLHNDLFDLNDASNKKDNGLIRLSDSSFAFYDSLVGQMDHKKEKMMALSFL
jgi:hypothetical protein